MTKAKDISKLVDGSGNLVANNAGADARSIGIVTGDGRKLSSLNRNYQQSTIAVSNCSGFIPNGNCATAVANGHKDETFNSTATYTSATGATVNQIDLPKPSNGNWWLWSSYGFAGVTTTNCANSGSYDGVGGSTYAFVPVTVDTKFYTSFTNDEEELGGTFQSRTVKNCNCGSFNCRTNCNCNCDCACACNCSTDGG
jgi:hypothetical protein